MIKDNVQELNINNINTLQACYLFLMFQWFMIVTYDIYGNGNNYGNGYSLQQVVSNSIKIEKLLIYGYSERSRSGLANPK